MTFPVHFKPYQDFVQEGRRFWKTELYADVIEVAKSHDKPDALLEEKALKTYSWFEKNLQQAKYYGPHGLIETFRREAESEGAEDFGIRTEQLDAWNDTLPSYYRDTGFHQHAPGVWPSVGDAMAYEYATTFFSFSLIAADVPYRRVAELIADMGKDWENPRVMDLGTGYGKLAFAIKRAMPNATVEGVDLSMPLIRLGQARAREMDLDVGLSCHQAEQIDQLDHQFEFITSYWLLHELPIDVIRDVAQASFNALTPGGYFMSLDMHRATGGALGKFLMQRHGIANDEPFIGDLLNWDFESDLKAMGYEDIRLVDPATRDPFDENKPLQSERTHEFSVLIARKPNTQ